MTKTSSLRTPLAFGGGSSLLSRQIVSVLDVVFVAAVITALATAPFLFMRWLAPKFIFGIAILVGLAVDATSTSVGRFQVQRLLKSQPHGVSVSINGNQVQNSDQILDALKGIRDLPAHHSSPSHRFRVDIYGQSHLVLLLARDSSDSREYWVFYPRHFITRSKEIGRIITPLFDAY